jgi:hypothetical protein
MLPNHFTSGEALRAILWSTSFDLPYVKTVNVNQKVGG